MFASEFSDASRNLRTPRAGEEKKKEINKTHARPTQRNHSEAKYEAVIKKGKKKKKREKNLLSP